MKRIALVLAAIAAIIYTGSALAVTPLTSQGKVFVCKYVGKPGVDERLQTGNNPISVSVNAIKEDPVVIGSFFADAQGRSFVLAFDIGQPEPPVTDCPPPTPDATPSPTASPTPVPPPPTPSPSPTASATASPSPTPTSVVTPEPSGSTPPSEEPSTPPSEEPSSPPDFGTFSVATCPAGVEVPVGQSAIELRGSVLLIILLNVRVDGQLVTLRDALGDGSVGDLFVTPGEHTISISNAADTEVLAEDTVFCPECNALVITPRPTSPAKTAPPTDVATGALDSRSPSLPVILLALAGLAGVALVLTRKRA